METANLLIDDDSILLKAIDSYLEENLEKGAPEIHHTKLAKKPPRWLPTKHHDAWSRTVLKHKLTTYPTAVMVFKRHLAKHNGKFVTTKHPDGFPVQGPRRVKQHVRRTKSGKAAIVREHVKTRGGKTIGRTKSGRKIYDRANHPAHAMFSKQDHREAEKLHLKLAAKYSDLYEKDPSSNADWGTEIHARHAAYHRIASMRKSVEYTVIPMESDAFQEPLLVNNNPNLVIAADGQGYMASNTITNEHIIRPGLDQLMLICHPRDIFTFSKVTYDKESGRLITSDPMPELSAPADRGDPNAFVVLQDHDAAQGGSVDAGVTGYQNPAATDMVSDDDNEYGVEMTKSKGGKGEGSRGGKVIGHRS